MKKKKVTRFIYTVPYMQTEGNFEKVDGYEVKIVEYASTFIAKRNGRWVVFESSTGKNINGGATIELAIAAAKKVFDQMGEEKTKLAISTLPKAPVMTNM